MAFFATETHIKGGIVEFNLYPEEFFCFAHFDAMNLLTIFVSHKIYKKKGFI